MGKNEKANECAADCHNAITIKSLSPFIFSSATKHIIISILLSAGSFTTSSPNLQSSKGYRHCRGILSSGLGQNALVLKVGIYVSKILTPGLWK